MHCVRSHLHCVGACAGRVRTRALRVLARLQRVGRRHSMGASLRAGGGDGAEERVGPSAPRASLRRCECVRGRVAWSCNGSRVTQEAADVTVRCRRVLSIERVRGAALDAGASSSTPAWLGSSSAWRPPGSAFPSLRSKQYSSSRGQTPKRHSAYRAYGQLCRRQEWRSVAPRKRIWNRGDRNSRSLNESAAVRPKSRGRDEKVMNRARLCSREWGPSADQAARAPDPRRQVALGQIERAAREEEPVVRLVA